LVAVDASGTTDPRSPLADLLHDRLRAALARWEELPPEVEPEQTAVAQFCAALSALERAAAVLCGEAPIDAPAASPPSWEELDAARSYAHLAGLLPRSLERVIRFDAAAAIVRRPCGEPVIDTLSHAPELAEMVRERALLLDRMLAGGTEDAAAHLPPRPEALRSALYFPLVADGVVVGTAYIASLQEGIYGKDDERMLRDLATHASGAIQRLGDELRGIRATPRQAQVLALVAAGLSDKEIASRLALSPRTVRTHLERILREYGLSSRTEAATAWLRGERKQAGDGPQRSHDPPTPLPDVPSPALGDSNE
jgi:DNA-binding CsgD family transcriptional regulator